MSKIQKVDGGITQTKIDEIIYVLINEAMPGYVKIGKTTSNLEKRMRELSTTGVPLPFTCFYACTVVDMDFVEHQLHDAFDNHRTNPKREFFQIAPERIVAALKLREIKDITPKKDYVDSREQQAALNQARKRRADFSFKSVDIPEGSEIYFSRNENIKAKVLDNHAIEVNGEKTSLSLSAQRILGYNYGVAGTDYWMFDGETLDERRRRLESKE